VGIAGPPPVETVDSAGSGLDRSFVRVSGDMEGNPERFMK
jgi:hypothetical protein